MARRSWSQGASPAWHAWIALVVVQLALSPFLHSQDGLGRVRTAGWVTWVIMCLFAWWPVVELRRAGGVEQGRPYTETMKLVKSGPYAFVRHPQYLSFILLSASLALIVQHWLITAAGAAAILLVYARIVPQAEILNRLRFGGEYLAYSEKVPSLNALGGLVRYHRSTKR